MKRALKSTSNCVDVGSHKGEVLKEMRSLAPKGRHFAFEPIPDLFADLKQRYNGNTTIFNYALSDKEGTSTFQHVVSKPAYSGMKQRSYDHTPTINEIEVKTQTLDAILPEGTPIDLIKIDVEGAELQVLKGARSIIKSNQPLVIFEHGLGASDHYGTTPEDVFNLLVGECGLKISLLPDFLAKKESLSKDQFKDQFYTASNYYFVAHP
ncbi:MAG: FkbM family methyltransferase [Flavobacteriales bacterium]